jgi:hypothetical protein
VFISGLRARLAYFSKATSGWKRSTPAKIERAKYSADITEAEKTQRPAVNIFADRLLPTATAQSRGLGYKVARTGQDQRPGQFNRRRRRIAGMDHLHAVFRGGREINRGIPGGGRGNQTQVRQPLDDRARHRRPLAHHTAEKGKERSADRHYKVMSLDNIKALGPLIQKLAAEDCALFLWGTWSHLPAAIELITSWDSATLPAASIG